MSCHTVSLNVSRGSFDGSHCNYFSRKLRYEVDSPQLWDGLSRQSLSMINQRTTSDVSIHFVHPRRIASTFLTLDPIALAENPVSQVQWGQLRLLPYELERNAGSAPKPYRVWVSSILCRALKETFIAHLALQRDGQVIWQRTYKLDPLPDPQALSFTYGSINTSVFPYKHFRRQYLRLSQP